MINYTIEALANEAGFNNATTFANAFKAKLDVLPSEYLEYLKKTKKASQLIYNILKSNKLRIHENEEAFKKFIGYINKNA